jgi:hypothetical protein
MSRNRLPSFLFDAIFGHEASTGIASLVRHTQGQPG